MRIAYTPHGVCSRQIQVEIEGNIIQKVRFIGGCHGNTQGISSLVEGMDVDKVIERLENIRCGNRPTSCPDQLTKALKLAKEQQN